MKGCQKTWHTHYRAHLLLMTSRILLMRISVIQHVYWKWGGEDTFPKHFPPSDVFRGYKKDSANNLPTIFIYRQRSPIAGQEFTHLQEHVSCSTQWRAAAISFRAIMRVAVLRAAAAPAQDRLQRRTEAECVNSSGLKMLPTRHLHPKKESQTKPMRWLPLNLPGGIKKINKSCAILVFKKIK